VVEVVVDVVEVVVDVVDVVWVVVAELFELFVAGILVLTMMSPLLDGVKNLAKMQYLGPLGPKFEDCLQVPNPLLLTKLILHTEQIEPGNSELNAKSAFFLSGSMVVPGRRAT